MTDSDDVKAVLRSILVTEMNGLTLPALEAEYRSLNGAGIPFKSLGHATLQAYVSSIPDAVALRRNPTGEFVAQVICTMETAHVRRMVSQQKKPGKPNPRRPLRNAEQKPLRQGTQPYRTFANSLRKNPQRQTAMSDFVIGSQRAPQAPGNAGAQFRPRPFRSAPYNPLPNQYSPGPWQNTRNNSNIPEHSVNWNVHKHPGNWTVSRRGPLLRYQPPVLPQPIFNRRTEQRQDVRGSREAYRDGSASTVASWVMFLVSADVYPGFVKKYASLLSKRGLTPDNAWVLTGEDLFRIGVRNLEHIHLIQHHAHKVGMAMGLLDDGTELNEDSFSRDLALHSNVRSSAGKRSTSSRKIASQSGHLQVTVQNEHCREECKEGATVDESSGSIYEIWDMCTDSDSENGSAYENIPPPKVLSKVQRASRGFTVTPMKVSSLDRLG